MLLYNATTTIPRVAKYCGDPKALNSDKNSDRFILILCQSKL